VSTGKQSFKMAAIGFLVALILVIAGGAAYAQTEKPTFCGGCHAMEDSYHTWQNSVHSTVACSECHLPHDNLATKLLAKAKTGAVDIYAQTLRNYDIDIQVTDKGKEYLQKNCLRCHESRVSATDMGVGKDGDGRDCTSCHMNLVHGSKTISQ
jgi:cytochrome c nitrite reductase small subunit